VREHAAAAWLRLVGVRWLTRGVEQVREEGRVVRRLHRALRQLKVVHHRGGDDGLRDGLRVLLLHLGLHVLAVDLGERGVVALVLVQHDSAFIRVVRLHHARAVRLGAIQRAARKVGIAALVGVLVALVLLSLVVLLLQLGPDVVAELVVELVLHRSRTRVRLRSRKAVPWATARLPTMTSSSPRPAARTTRSRRSAPR
jgi:hypothetical protein